MKLSEGLEAKRLEDRPVKCWAVSYGNGHIDITSISLTRREAIRKFLDFPGSQGWDYWREKGCSAIKVRLVPEAGKGESRE